MTRPSRVGRGLPGTRGPPFQALWVGSHRLRESALSSDGFHSGVLRRGEILSGDLMPCDLFHGEESNFTPVAEPLDEDTARADPLAPADRRQAAPARFWPLNCWKSAEVALTATVTPNAPGAGAPSGTLTFFDGNTVLATVQVVNGQAFFYVHLSPGKHTLTVVYSGDSDFLGGTSNAIMITI